MVHRLAGNRGLDGDSYDWKDVVRGVQPDIRILSRERVKRSRFLDAAP